MQVFKCIVMTNGTYACEVWNYTRVEIDRLEKHYFRLLRDTMLMSKYSTTYLQVLSKARNDGVVKVYTIECYVQRQQLKFLWKVLHLDDLALQKIVLHGRLDKGLRMGRGGRTRTYKQCILEALDSFNVTIDQCMGTAKHDWNTMLEDTGMAIAVEKWERRLKAGRAIDSDWKNSSQRLAKKKRAQVEMTTVEGTKSAVEAEADGEEEEGSVDSAEEDDTADNEFDHLLVESQEASTSIMIPRATTLEKYEESQGSKPVSRKHRYDRRSIKETKRRATIDQATILASTGIEYDNRGPEEDKRTAKTVARHRRRSNKRARTVDPPELTIIGEDVDYRAEVDLEAIPWEHRGLLGRTSGKQGGTTGMMTTQFQGALNQST